MGVIGTKTTSIYKSQVFLINLSFDEQIFNEKPSFRIK